jgi:hypothetical protein
MRVAEMTITQERPRRRPAAAASVVRDQETRSDGSGARSASRAGGPPRRDERLRRDVRAAGLRAGGQVAAVLGGQGGKQFGVHGRLLRRSRVPVRENGRAVLRYIASLEVLQDMS